MNPITTWYLETLPEPVWRERAERHFQAAREFTVRARRRRDHGEAHPVEDFLFTYYPYSISLLEQWHPAWVWGCAFPKSLPLPRT